jgi:hypothetical protein
MGSSSLALEVSAEINLVLVNAIFNPYSFVFMEKAKGPRALLLCVY